MRHTCRPPWGNPLISIAFILDSALSSSGLSGVEISPREAG
jgi:hypothetical protein